MTLEKGILQKDCATSKTKLWLMLITQTLCFVLKYSMSLIH